MYWVYPRKIININFKGLKMLGQIKKVAKKSRMIRLIHSKCLNAYKRLQISSIKKRDEAFLKHKRCDTSQLKVLFIVIHAPVWKVDSVFQKMLTDNHFYPYILVAPFIKKGKIQMQQNMDETYHYFRKKGYPVVKAQKDGKWIDVEAEISPDIVFFTNPHNLTMKLYYTELYKKYVSYYVPYSHQISRYNDYYNQYNQLFHNVMRRIFSPHMINKEIHENYSDNQGDNVEVTGYPAMEPFMDNNYQASNPWKKQNKQKFKIIWAPHHTIDSPSLPYANFLKYAEFFQSLVEQYKETVQWAFKPHPLLKVKLFNHPEWGKEKTDAFWDFWQNHPNCQLENDEYVDLFLTSDAMIHDSGSFLAEYLYTNNPVLFMVSSPNIQDYFNPIGCKAFEACYHAKQSQDITNFIENLIAGNDTMKENRLKFLEKDIFPFFQDKMPSERIIESIKKDFGITES